MTIDLSDQEIGDLRITTEQARVDFAIGLYTGRHASLGRAAKIAGMATILFMREMGKRGIGLHYSMEDALHDLRMVDVLSRKAGKS